MIVPKTLSKLNHLTIDGIEENTFLEYKSGDALQNTDPGK